ncbi:amino acid oxidase [Paractinoplanes deccanensis]|uniref:D-amino-acid oxidase n=1 Tax=Paractinoplanes deccanensis TaxID=113561 RepID=A0ABQ3Y9A2_9ACTN|nr:FAD-dependent oxidoreductase [Actinoplanes deccanensis]GID76557.1 amino acid oxidase [Actinoplanes deccanensis]
MKPDVLVIGAGVVGLTTALRLAEQGLRVRIRADTVQRDTTSAAAGAIWGAELAEHPDVRRWTATGFAIQSRLAEDPATGVRVTPGVEASRTPVAVPDWATATVGAAELPPGFVTGWRYEAPVTDMPVHLAWLAGQFAGEVIPGRVERLADAFAEAPIVVNCTGLGARELGPDPSMRACRGQLVAVRNPGLDTFFLEYTDFVEEMTYLIPQGPVLLLGGCAFFDDERLDPDPAVAARIVERCAAVHPAVADAEVIEHRVGLRPMRPTVRLEHEDLGDGRHLIHNYGHGGAGVSTSWGCAGDVAEIVSGLLSGPARP